MIFDKIMPLNPDRIEQINRLWALYGFEPGYIEGWGQDEEIRIHRCGGSHLDEIHGRWSFSDAEWIGLMTAGRVLTYNGITVPDP